MSIAKLKRSLAMPTKRVRRVRTRADGLTERRLHFLKTGELFEKFKTLFRHSPPTLEDCWQHHGADITRKHIKRHPCTRPTGWWMFDCPDEYRRIVGGDGGGECGPTLPGSNYWDHIQSFEWIGPAGVKVESKAAFLARHELLTPVELNYLSSHP